MRILVCGGRDFTDVDRFNQIMSHCIWWEVVTDVIHGAARGADTLADQWAKHLGIDVHAYPADWAKYGRSAGAVRNQRMLDEGKPDLVIAFPGGMGTALMVKLARKAGVEVLQVVK